MSQSSAERLEKLKADLALRRANSVGTNPAAGRGTPSSPSGVPPRRLGSSPQSSNVSSPNLSPSNSLRGNTSTTTATRGAPAAAPSTGGAATPAIGSSRGTLTSSPGSGASAPQEIDGTEFFLMLEDLKLSETQQMKLLALPAGPRQKLVDQWKLRKNRQSTSVAVKKPTPESTPTPSIKDSEAKQALETLKADVEARRQKLLQQRKEQEERLAKLKQDVQQKKEAVSPAESSASASAGAEEETRTRAGSFARTTRTGAGTNIRSLKDVQQTIKNVEHSNKIRAAENLEKKILRDQKKEEIEKTRKVIRKSIMAAPAQTLTPEERRLQRESKMLLRQSKHLEAEKSHLKINSQLTVFLQSMVRLEEEFRRYEEDRINRQAEFEILQKEKEALEQKVKQLERVLNQNHVQAPPPPPAPLISRDEAVRRRKEELAKEAETSGGGVGDLLAQIRKGTSLKTVTADDKKPANLRQSLNLITSLQDTLTNALEARYASMNDSDSDEDSGVWDEDDDEFSQMLYDAVHT